jgi:hypothetical protein
LISGLSGQGVFVPKQDRFFHSPFRIGHSEPINGRFPESIDLRTVETVTISEVVAPVLKFSEPTARDFHVVCTLFQGCNDFLIDVSQKPQRMN